MVESNARPAAVPEEGSTCTPASRRQTLPSDGEARRGRVKGKDASLPGSQSRATSWVRAFPFRQARPPGRALASPLPGAPRWVGALGILRGVGDASSRRVTSREWRLKLFWVVARGEATRCKGRKDSHLHFNFKNCLFLHRSKLRAQRSTHHPT